MNDKKYLWVSKYALTTGITKHEWDGRVSGNGIVTPDLDNRLWTLFLGTDVHETEQEAIEHAEKMRLRKIESIKKQLAKLEKLTFKKEGSDE
jgi:hypothetical protein